MTTKHFTLLIAFIFFRSINSNAQTSIEWQRTFGGSGIDLINCVRQTYDGGYILGGNTKSNNGDIKNHHGDYDYWITKLNSSGVKEWSKCFGGNGVEEMFAIEQTNDSGYVIAGYTTSNNNGDVGPGHGSADYWIVKLKKSGELQWQKCLGGSGEDKATSIVQSSEGGYFIVGSTRTEDNGDVKGNHGRTDTWLVKLSEAGNLEWQKCFGGSDFEFTFSIKQTTDHGFVIAGSAVSKDGDLTGSRELADYWILKIDALANIQWQKSFGGTESDEANYIQQTPDGGYIVSGTTRSDDGDVSTYQGNGDIWILKLKNDGTMEWQRSLGGSSYETGYEIIVTSDNEYAVVGKTASNDKDVSGNHGDSDVWLVKLDASGKTKWQKCFGGKLIENVFALQQTMDGGFIIGGLSYSKDGDLKINNGISDGWVVKLAGDHELGKK